jgi:hypothetical protein
MGEVSSQVPRGTGGPIGHRGHEGWSGTDKVVAEDTTVHNLHWVGNERVDSRTEEFLYVDQTNREVGIRTKDGGRVFVSLDVLLGLLRRGVFR